MDESTHLTGVVPVVPTPFRADESIDFESVARSVRFAAEQNFSAICLPAYASEFYKLSTSEREQLVAAAIDAADGRVKVIGQSNHPSANQAAAIARRNEDRGADLISFALPRQFALPEDDLLAYSETICRAVSRPVLIQDFNPSGATIGGDFCRRLKSRVDNFAYVKLEEPLMGAKLRQVREATNDRVGVLEGWGGMYMLELIEPGVRGLMPGLAVADLLQAAWNDAQRGDWDNACARFEQILPQIVYSLQSMEFFLWMEKDLLARRGIISSDSTHVRSATLRPDEDSWKHAVRLNERIARMCHGG